MTHPHLRTAQKQHRCTGGHPIRPGDRYLSGTIAPGQDPLNTAGWTRLAECALCATRYGRAHLFTNTPRPARDPHTIADTADIVLLSSTGIAADVLLIQRDENDPTDPNAGRWALPGGFLDPGETSHDAAIRELNEECDYLTDTLFHVGRYDAPGRDPRGPISSDAYTRTTSFHGVITAGDDAQDAQWAPVEDIVNGYIRVAFDHRMIILDALPTAHANLRGDTA